MRWISSITLIILLALSLNAKADHCAGGEIAYQWLHDSTYRMYFKFYRDCSGIPEGISVTLCASNICNTQKITKSLPKMTTLPDGSTNGQEIATGCAGYPTRCGSTTSTIPGYKEWWYSDTLTLTSKCTQWKFSVSIGARNAAVNIGPPNNPTFYVEATLDNLNAPENSSPFFSVKPVPYVCINQPYTYNNGAVDPNADSLSFEIVQPLMGSSCAVNVNTIPFRTATPALNIINNPFQTNNSFNINVNNGQMNFTAALQGKQTITVKANEYRNGALIGSVMRDIQVQVLVCSSTQPSITIAQGTLAGAVNIGGTVVGCSGVPMSFCFDLKSPTPGAVLVATDNHGAAAPGSTILYAGQKTDSIRGCFDWTASTLDTGLRVLTITAKDSTCNPPGIAISQSFVIPVYINPITDIVKDTAICQGDSVKLTAVGGSVFTWNVLPGGSPITSLSCTACKTPIAKPAITTQYEVISNLAGGCGKNRDTVTVVVADLGALKPIATSNSPVCTGNQILLNATPFPNVTYNWSGPNGFTSNDVNPKINTAALIHNGYYKVNVSLKGCSSEYDSVLVVVNQTPAAPVPTSNSPLCAGDTLKLFASTVGAASYAWTGPGSYTSVLQNPELINAQISNAGTYKVKAIENGCESTLANTVVVVNPKPVITATSFLHPTTCNGIDGSIILFGLQPSTTYNVGLTKNGSVLAPISTLTDATGKAVVSGLSAGVYTNIELLGILCAPAPVAGPITLTDPPLPVVSASNNTPVCEGDSIKLFATLIAGATYNWSGPSFTSTSQNPYIANSVVTHSGTYTVTATRNNCISAPATTDVVVKQMPTVPVATSNSPLCTGSALNLNATSTPGASFSWSGPSFTSALANPVINNAQLSHAGTYSVTASLNGCTSQSGSTIVVVNLLPAINGTDHTNPTTCFGTNGSIVLKGLLPANTYTVNYTKNSIPQTAIITSNASGEVIISGLTAGTYATITVTQIACTSNAVGPITLVDPLPPVITATNNGPICAGDTLKLFTVNVPGAIYTWSGPVSFGSAAQNPYIANAQTFNSGTYTVTATLNNCVSVAATTNAIVKTMPIVPLVSSNTPLCDGGTINLFAGSTNGSSYSWSGPNSFTSVLQNPVILNINSIHSGTYTVTATLNGCTSGMASVTLTVHPIPLAPTVVTPVVYCEQDPTAALNATGSNLLWYTNITGGVGSSTVPVPSTMTATNYTWYVSQTVNGCESPRKDIYVHVKYKPNAPVVKTDITYCKDDITLPLVATGNDLKWYLVPVGGGFLTATPIPYSAVPGTFNWYVTQTIDGCESDRSNIKVDINPIPAAPVVNDAYYCEGQKATQLNAGGNYIRWYSSPTATSYSFIAPVPVTTPVGVTDYYVSQTVKGCESPKALIHAIVNPQVHATIEADNYTVCTFDTVEIRNAASGNPVTTNNLWDFDNGVVAYEDATKIKNGVSWITPGLKRIILNSNNLNCSGADTAEIEVRPKPEAYFGYDEDICVEERTELLPNKDNKAIYLWNFETADIIDTSGGHVYVTWNSVGRKRVILQLKANNECVSKPFEGSLMVHEKPEADITSISRDGVCTDDTVMLTAKYIGGYTYNWTPKEYFENNNNDRAAAKIHTASYVTVHVTDKWECKNADSVMVNTIPCCDAHFADAFTPNGDGRNDVFRIITIGNHNIGRFIIVNRWGNIVFETTDERQGWDGTYKGQPQEPGTYFYYLKYTCSDNRTLEKKGEVVLMR